MGLGGRTVISPLQYLVTLNIGTMHDVTSVRDLHFLLLNIAGVHCRVVHYYLCFWCIIAPLTHVASIDCRAHILNFSGVSVAILLDIVGMHNRSIGLYSC